MRLGPFLACALCAFASAFSPVAHRPVITRSGCSTTALRLVPAAPANTANGEMGLFLHCCPTLASLPALLARTPLILAIFHAGSRAGGPLPSDGSLRTRLAGDCGDWHPRPAPLWPRAARSFRQGSGQVRIWPQRGHRLVCRGHEGACRLHDASARRIAAHLRATACCPALGHPLLLRCFPPSQEGNLEVDKLKTAEGSPVENAQVTDVEKDAA